MSVGDCKDNRSWCKAVTSRLLLKFSKVCHSWYDFSVCACMYVDGKIMYAYSVGYQELNNDSLLA